MAGANPTEAHPVVGARLRQAVLAGAPLLVIDPRRIELAEHADLHLALRPGTNVALFNALAKVLLEEDLWDRGYAAERLEGLEELEALTSRLSLAEAAAATGVAVEAIRRAARLLAHRGPALFVHGLGLSELTQGTASVMALCNLGMLTGAIGRPGAGMLPLRGQNNVQGNADMGSMPNQVTGYQPLDDPEVRGRLAGLWGAAPPLAPGLTVTEMIDAAAAGSLRGLWIQGEDIAQSDPQEDHVCQALERLELLVVQELFLTETARLADVVLPAQAFTEREGTFTSGERRVQRYYPAVPARPEARPDYAITAGLAALLDIELEGRIPSRIMARLAEQVPDYRDITYRRLSEAPPQWPIVGGRDDRYYGGTAYENSQGLGVQLMPAVQRGQAPTLAWLEPPSPVEHPEGSLLAVPVTRLYDRGRTVLPSELLHPRLAQPQVILHPDDAAGLGVAANAEVHISLNGTQTSATAHLDEGVPEGAALVPRSLGIPIHEPLAVRILPVAEAAGA